AVGGKQRRQDPDGRRLARAVRAEEREDRRLGDLEVDAVEDDLVAERLAETRDLDGRPDARRDGAHGRASASSAPARCTAMSPNEVRARISTAVSPGPGRSEASSSLLTLPNFVFRSSHAGTPSATPMSTRPKAVSATTEPCPTARRRMSPFAVLAWTAAPARSTAIRPLAAFARNSPATSPIQVLPLAFLTLAGPSTPPTSMAPEPVLISAPPCACSTLTSPAPVWIVSGPVWSSRIAPAPALYRSSPSRPVLRSSATPASPSTR